MNDSRRSLLPALLAVGTGMAAAPAAAIELGEINVQSTLGQPLRASIAYALQPNEQIAEYCITLKPGLSKNGLPAITNANISIADGIISLTGRTAIREPLMTLRVDVACPYTPNLSREYMLFIDPAAPTVAAEPVATPAVVASVPAAAASQTIPQPAVQEPRRSTSTPVIADSAPIDGADRYRVQPGDSLSLIAQRVDGRGIGLWDAAARIFDANPGAFIDNDPNKLKAGSWLTIPDLSGGDATAFSTETPATPTAVTSSPSDVQATTGAAYEPPVSLNVPASEESLGASAESLAEPAREAATASNEFADDTRALAPAEATSSSIDALDNAALAELETGDLVVEDSSIVIPDTELEAPALGDSPNGTVAVIATPDETPQRSTNWLYWLVGGGLALIAGLLVFGRRRRSDDDEVESAAATAPHPMRRHTDRYETMPELEELMVDDDDPTEENLALDADLVMGTGLNQGIDVEVAEDLGFEGEVAALDLELPEETEDTGEVRNTDILSVPNIEASSILESEILPEDDDYDMSVIVDATKMPNHDDVTQQDLRAVPVPGGDETLISDSYTVSQEIDYQILEQDYEDELTATQALNLEIEKAAAELSEDMADDDDQTVRQDVGDEHQTHELPKATVTELDVTANLQSAEEDTTEEIETTEETVEMARKNVDDTVEMEVESGTIDTKAL